MNKNNYRAKQVIVVRKDLDMKKGKLSAQVAHASLANILSMMNKKISINGKKYKRILKYNKNSALYEWLEGRFTKIIVYVENEKELWKIHNLALSKKISCRMIQDAGFTVFNEPTYTCCAIGPDFNEKVDEITKNLKKV